MKVDLLGGGNVLILIQIAVLFKTYKILYLDFMREPLNISTAFQTWLGLIFFVTIV